ncbi:MAG TPA: hypothetical protein VF443_10290 [Nitrospira sp.]
MAQQADAEAGMKAISEAQVRGAKANAIGDGRNRRICTQTMWLVKGEISGHTVTRRISAPDYDTAITEAHAIPMAVDTCIQIPSTQK